MLLDFPLPIFVNFLKMDFSDVPAIVAALALGPIAGVLTELIKNLVKMLFKFQSGGIGEIANFLIGSAYVLPLGLIYHKGFTKKSVDKVHSNNISIFIGAFVGSICMVVFASLLNYVFLIPAYAKIFGMPIETFVEMGHALNASINDMKTLVLLSVAPFNIVKAIVMSVIGIILYRLLGRFLNR
jgi:riboflavin transporter FmnP